MQKVLKDDLIEARQVCADPTSPIDGRIIQLGLRGDGENVYKWKMKVKGTLGTVYEHLLYDVFIDFHRRHPFEPPRVFFPKNKNNLVLPRHEDVCEKTATLFIPKLTLLEWLPTYRAKDILGWVTTLFSTDPRVPRSFYPGLGTDQTYLILQYLDYFSVLSTRGVCTDLKTIIEEDSLWVLLYRQQQHKFNATMVLNGNLGPVRVQVFGKWEWVHLVASYRRNMEALDMFRRHKYGPSSSLDYYTKQLVEIVRSSRRTLTLFREGLMGQPGMAASSSMARGNAYNMPEVDPVYQIGDEGVAHTAHVNAESQTVGLLPQNTPRGRLERGNRLVSIINHKVEQELVAAMEQAEASLNEALYLRGQAPRPSQATLLRRLEDFRRYVHDELSSIQVAFRRTLQPGVLVDVYDKADDQWRVGRIKSVGHKKSSNSVTDTALVPQHVAGEAAAPAPIPVPPPVLAPAPPLVPPLPDVANTVGVADFVAPQGPVDLVPFQGDILPGMDPFDLLEADHPELMLLEHEIDGLHGVEHHPDLHPADHHMQRMSDRQSVENIKNIVVGFVGLGPEHDVTFDANVNSPNIHSPLLQPYRWRTEKLAEITFPSSKQKRTTYRKRTINDIESRKVVIVSALFTPMTLVVQKDCNIGDLIGEYYRVTGQYDYIDGRDLHMYYECEVDACSDEDEKMDAGVGDETSPLLGPVNFTVQTKSGRDFAIAVSHETAQLIYECHRAGFQTRYRPSVSLRALRALAAQAQRRRHRRSGSREPKRAVRLIRMERTDAKASVEEISMRSLRGNVLTLWCANVPRKDEYSRPPHRNPSGKYSPDDRSPRGGSEGYSGGVNISRVDLESAKQRRQT